MGRIRQRLFAFLLAHGTGGYEAITSTIRADLLKEIEAPVLELGPGTGVNFKYCSPTSDWIGLEPNPFLANQLTERRPSTWRDQEPTILRGRAEEIPLKKASVGTVISTLVLCSVTSPEQVLKEVIRVLRPGGRFVFLEHVAAGQGSRLRRLQNLATPITCCLGDGCHLNRETWKSIQAAGFAETDIRHLNLNVPFHGPHIAGTARK